MQYPEQTNKAIFGVVGKCVQPLVADRLKTTEDRRATMIDPTTQALRSPWVVAVTAELPIDTKKTGSRIKTK